MDADFCARLLPTTPLFALADGKRWVRRDIPVSGGQIESIKFADRKRGVVIVHDLTPTDPDPDSCYTGGDGTTSGVYITSDGGRRWRRTFTCKSACFAVSWSTPRRLVLGQFNGQVFTSDDSGAHFAPGSTLIPDVASPYRGLDGLACLGKRCYAQSRGVVFRSDDAGAEWVEEITPSGGALLIGDLAMFDRDRAIGVGPYTIITRGTAPASAR